MSIVHTATAGAATVIVFDRALPLVNDQLLILTAQEEDFLLILAEAKGMVRTNRMLVSRLFRGKHVPELKLFDVLTCKIKAKMRELHEDAPNVIRTVWGRGYAFGEPKLVEPIRTVGALPDRGARWTPARKLQVVQALRNDVVDGGQVQAAYPDLTSQELDEWVDAALQHGVLALHATRARHYAY